MVVLLEESTHIFSYWENVYHDEVYCMQIHENSVK